MTDFLLLSFVWGCVCIKKKKLRIVEFRNLLMAEAVEHISAVHRLLPCISVYGCSSGLRNWCANHPLLQTNIGREPDIGLSKQLQLPGYQANQLLMFPDKMAVE